MKTTTFTELSMFSHMLFNNALFGFSVWLITLCVALFLVVSVMLKILSTSLNVITRKSLVLHRLNEITKTLRLKVEMHSPCYSTN